MDSSVSAFLFNWGGETVHSAEAILLNNLAIGIGLLGSVIMFFWMIGQFRKIINI